LPLLSIHLFIHSFNHTYSSLVPQKAITAGQQQEQQQYSNHPSRLCFFLFAQYLASSTMTATLSLSSRREERLSPTINAISSNNNNSKRIRQRSFSSPAAATTTTTTEKSLLLSKRWMSIWCLLWLSTTIAVSAFAPVQIPSQASSPSSLLFHNNKKDATTALQATTTAPRRPEDRSSSSGGGGWWDNLIETKKSLLPNQQQQQQQSQLQLLSASWNRLQTLIPPSISSSSLPATTTTVAAQQNAAIVDDYQRRKDEWALKYTSVDALRHTFGTNRNAFWGDLPASTARRLYKTLLPRALLELVKLGVQPQDLAPLAYRARVAAKLYARERCALPARIAANLYDGFRQWRRYGTFNTSGMTYQQIWNKYRQVILQEDDCRDLTDEDVTAKICLRILERSCATNEMVDRLVLSQHPKHPNKKRAAAAATDQELQEFTEKLECDVRRLLAPPSGIMTTTATATTISSSGLSSSTTGRSMMSSTTTTAFRADHSTTTTTDDARALAAAVKRYHNLRKIVRLKRRLQLATTITTSTTLPLRS